MPTLPSLQRRDRLRGVKRAVLCGLAIVSSFLISGCSGDNDGPKDGPPPTTRDGPPPTPTDGPPQSPRDGPAPPPQSPPVTIRGGERLAWSQDADSAQLRSLTFSLYVDGQASTLSATRCNETGLSSVFECSGQLPTMSVGQHSLELTSVLAGVESGRSPRLLVAVVRAAATTGAVSLEQSAPANSTICSDEPGTNCYGVQVIASGLGAVTALSPMPDGRVMFIEAGQHIRIIDRDASGGTIALPAESNRQLTGLAIDTQFEKSRSVFVAWTELVRDVLVVNVTRYRELGNVLGEGATIVTGLPVTSDSPTPLVVDDEGLIYVAVPANRSVSGPRFLGDAGAVMRFDRDGRVPSSNQNASPIVAAGYPTPLALAIDRSTRTVWLTGRNDQQSGEIAVIEIPALSRGTWPSHPLAVEAQVNGRTQVESIAIDETASVRGAGVHLVIAREGGVRSVLLGRGAVRQISDIRLGNAYFADAVATDRDGALYVGAASRDGAISLLKLTKLSR
jgi:hypothetical protein